MVLHYVFVFWARMGLLVLVARGFDCVVPGVFLAQNVAGKVFFGEADFCSPGQAAVLVFQFRANLLLQVMFPGTRIHPLERPSPPELAHQSPAL